jgi:hypothetical protein
MHYGLKSDITPCPKSAAIERTFNGAHQYCRMLARKLTALPVRAAASPIVDS